MGLIASVAASHDKRVKQLSLTSEGRKLEEALHKEQARLLSQAFSRIGDTATRDWMAVNSQLSGRADTDEAATRPYRRPDAKKPVHYTRAFAAMSTRASADFLVAHFQDLDILVAIRPAKQHAIAFARLDQGAGNRGNPADMAARQSISSTPTMRSNCSLPSPRSISTVAEKNT
jgi:hypothetical protein